MKQVNDRLIKYSFILIIAILSLSCTATQTSDSCSGVTISSYDQQTVDNLYTLCKVWGFLKYYHPVISTGKYDWDKDLFQVMPKILNVKSKQERATVLENWVSKYGEITSSSPMPDISPDIVKMYPDSEWMKDTMNLGDMTTLLQKINNAKREVDTTYYVGFPYGSSPFFEDEKNYSELTSLDVGYRLLSLFRFWNVIQYYFPYKYLIESDWNDVLREFIPKFIDSSDNKLEYKLLVLKLVTRIDDSHARIVINSPQLLPDTDISDWEGVNMLPFEITFIEDKAVITDVYSTKSNEKYPFLVGDIINSINKESVESIVSRKSEYTPASHYSGKLKKIAETLLLCNEENMAVEYERNGIISSGEFKTCLKSEVDVTNRTRRNLPSFSLWENGIGYIYMGSTRGDSLPEYFEANVKGLIIDLRCYPNSIKNYWEYFPLFPEPTPFVRFTKASISYPGLYFLGESTKTGKENPNHFKGKKVILINEYTQSHAEFMVMKYKSSPNTTLIGSKTTGSDGNISVINLPAETTIVFTGLGVYYPDGGETQRIGILPDIEVKPTIKGFREGKDEVLEKAKEFILKGSI